MAPVVDVVCLLCIVAFPEFNPHSVYHESGNEASVLVGVIAELVKKREQTPDKDAARINDNIRGVETYLKHFANRKFVVLDTPKPRYTAASCMTLNILRFKKAAMHVHSAAQTRASS